ncbi:hypothetical protein MKEN_00357900 [Mycena kentingensis (nom. inval.)]|nr:hypothetical protein MKEN_00357900 [Mycena kentingensis (nom. inval.)]
MSSTSSPEDTTHPDVVVVLTADDAAARERLLAKRAMRRIENQAKRHAQAQDKQSFGVTLMKIKNYEGAAASFGEACNLWRTNPVVHCDLATAYLHLGRFEDAEASASNALNLDPRLVEARYVRGMARKGRGVERAAIVDFETVLQLEPSNAAAQAQLRELIAHRATSPEPVPVPAPAVAETDDAAPEVAPALQPPVDAAPPATTAPAETSSLSADVDPDFDPAHPLITPDPSLSALPTLDPELLSTSDTSDAQHTGSGTPCLFYNHGGCMRGSACAFSHAPDYKSVRDGLGKNVCLYFLLGLCKFGKGKCIYSHERKWLAEGGWWDDEGVVERVKGRVERERERKKERREVREAEKEKKRLDRAENKAKGRVGGRKGKGRGHAAANGNGNANGHAKPDAAATHRKTPSAHTHALGADPLTAEIERRMQLFAAMGIPTGGLSPNDVLRQMQAIAASGVPLQPHSPLVAAPYATTPSLQFTPGIGVPISPGIQIQQMQQMGAGGEALAKQIAELEGRMKVLREKEADVKANTTKAEGSTVDVV